MYGASFITYNTIKNMLKWFLVEDQWKSGIASRNAVLQMAFNSSFKVK